jgi:translocation and assembly module TamB
MRRRRLVALVSVTALALIALIAVGTGLFVTGTDYGRNALLRDRVLAPLLERAVHGSVHLGKLHGNLVTGFTIDTIAIRDERGELFVSSGPITITWDPRDIVDRRVFIRAARIEHPYVHLIQHANDTWNYKEIFASGKGGALNPSASRAFGDYVVIDSAAIHDGTFVLSLPWHADDPLRGARLDSALAANRAALHDIRRTYDGYARTYTWRNGDAFVAHARIADPDSDRVAGQLFVVDTLRIDESDPPFKFSDARLQVRRLGDSVWLQVPHFDLPASTGHAAGKVVWGSRLPVRYDIAVTGDSVALNDVAWVYPTLPRTGGGTMQLHIRSEADPHVIDYQLTNMDVRSTRSRLLGSMTFGVGGPELAVRNVDLRAAPVNFDLLRTLAGGPFGLDWQGNVEGSVRARGGPLHHFVVDAAQGSFRDAHVPGAVSRFSARGELDIFRPAFTTFHGFDVTVSPFDLRTIERLSPSFPRLGGVIAGRARLDSVWTDVRFTNADILHEDGPGAPSHLTGSGRITYGKFLGYDVALTAAPLSLTTLARSYPALPFRGLVSGPIRVAGSAPDLAVSAQLTGEAGAFSYTGRLDIDSLGGYGVHGQGDFASVRPTMLLERPELPTGTLSGSYTADVAFTDLATLSGAASVMLDRTTFDKVTVYPSVVRTHFADGVAHVDSLVLHTTAGILTATGGIGLPHGRDDSLRVVAALDSLGGLRRYIGRPDTAVTGIISADSLSGAVTADVLVRGRLDSLGATGTLAATDLYVRGDGAGEARVNFGMRYADRAFSGSVRASADSLRAAGIFLDSLRADALLRDPTHGTFSLLAARDSTGRVSAGGSLALTRTAQVVRLDSLGLQFGRSNWGLTAPAAFTHDSAGMRLDSLHLRDDAGNHGSILAYGDIPSRGPVSAGLRASGVPLSDLGLIEQLPDSIAGVGDLTALVAGTKAAPVISVSSVLRDVQAGSVHLESVQSSGTYNDGTLNASLELFRNGQPALNAEARLPLDVTLFTAHIRPTDSLHVGLRADSAELGILETFTRGVQRASGRIRVDASLDGTWRNRTLAGTMAVQNGAMSIPGLGIRATGINAAARLADGALIVDSVRATSEGSAQRGYLLLSGRVADVTDSLARSFDLTLRASNFHAVSRRDLADLSVSTSTPLHLGGGMRDPVLSGVVTVDRGSIFLPDPALAEKRLSDLTVDTAAANASLERFLNALQLDNVQVGLGDDVWLRSREANVKLAGTLNVAKVPPGTPRLPGTSTNPILAHFALQGDLTADRGTYVLNLNPVQREFSVMQGGRVSFLGTSDNNPLINISAQYNVKRSGRPDLVVVATVNGPLYPGPKVDLTSTESYTISPSDLVSYLLIGQPGFDFASNPDVTQTLAQVLAPTASAVLGNALRGSLGSWVDLLQFQGGATDQTQATTTQPGLLQSFLANASIGGETQVTNKLFFTFSAGLCQLSGHAVAGQSATDALSGQLEWRFRPDLKIQGGREAPTSARTCGSSVVSGIVETPPQWSLSLFKTWRF